MFVNIILYGSPPVRELAWDLPLPILHSKMSDCR
jgi:hypothetical protein